MAWYFIFPIVVFLIATFYKEKPWSGVLVVFFMLFFSMFRGDLVGTDTQGYLDDYSTTALNYTYGFNVGKYEFLYYALCSFIYTHGLSPRLLIWFFSVVTILFVYLGCKRFKVNVTIFASIYILLLVYLLSFNISRQCAVVSLIFYASSFLSEKNIKRYFFILFVLVASLIHTTSVFVLALFPLSFFKLNRTTVGVVVYLFSIIGCFFPMSMSLVELFSNIGLFELYYDSYGVGGKFEMQESSLIGRLYSVFMLSICLFVYMTSSKQKKTNYMDLLFLFAMLGWGVLAAEVSLATNRIKIYFTIFMCLYFSRYFENMENNDMKKLLWFVLSSLWYLFLAQNSSLQEPYYMQFTL